MDTLKAICKKLNVGVKQKSEATHYITKLLNELRTQFKQYQRMELLNVLMEWCYRAFVRC
ncbi:hypothetical protein PHMEG_00039495 [Phytophthora megakarya]|uniref:Uncharacterized protein n=1 Tax=Phytophthora megakarya TaxID=4795 RepID=A0A225UFM7_9STRA|nr:hypothetical protein PHMEG_00039495 [Phytophthora megakarya]